MSQKKKQFRHELKYYINYSDYLALRTRLASVLRLDPNADENREYFIRSLYFDDIYDSALFEKNFGVFRRNKYRIRIYNYNDKTIKLERKSKVDQYICKESDTITRVEYDAIMNNNFDFLNADNSSDIRKDYFFMMRNNVLRPKVIVDYDREAYIGAIGNVRITFDKQLRVAYSSNDIFSRDIATRCIIPEPMMILEVKYDDFLPDVVRAMLNIKARDMSAISKYVFCRVQKNNI